MVRLLKTRKKPRHMLGTTLNLLKKHWGMLAINLVVLIIGLVWIKTIPYGVPGDEPGHYNYNVRIIAEEHRLPVAAKDDLENIKNCTEGARFGKLPCGFPFTIYPATGYVLEAAGANAADTVGVSKFIGARFVSLLLVVGFLNFLYASMRLIGTRRAFATLITGGVAFIPQLMFIGASVTNDTFALFASGFLGFSTIALLKRYSTKNAILFAVAVGLLLSSKYNYFVYLPFLAGLFAVAWRNKWLTTVQLRTVGLLTGAGAVLISGFWYIRNLVLYHDPLGQQFMLEQLAKYHKLGPVYDLNPDTILFMIRRDWPQEVLLSHFAHFTEKFWPLQGATYEILLFLIGAAAVYFVVELALYANRREKLWTLGWALFAAAGVMQLVGLTLQYSYSPQGRYLFTLTFPTALLFAYLTRRSQFQKYAIGFFAVTVFLLVMSTSVILKLYAPDNVTPKLERPEAFHPQVTPDLDWRLP